MSIIVLTQASSGAPALTPANGSLNAVLWWALAQQGWTRPYTASNADIFVAGSGNQRPLSVRHDSTVSGDARFALVRGCESASGATTIVDPFPTVAQVANNSANWMVSSSSTVAARNYVIIVSETWFILCIRLVDNGSAAGNWSLNIYGDLPTDDPSDAWATLCTTRSTTSVGASTDFGIQGVVGVPLAGTLYAFFCRDITGTVKSSRANGLVMGNSMGVVGSAPAPRGGYANRIEREKVSVSCCGSSSATPGPLSQIRRAWVPNLWSPIHSSKGALLDTDFFTDTPYAVGSLFRVYDSNGQAWWLLEETDTWSLPVG